MSIVSISDVHVKSRGDAPYQLLLRFLNSPETFEAESIYFLGDIFDLMVGEHLTYLEDFPEFFEKIKTFGDNGKKIIFIEGNHDVHLRKIFESIIPKNNFTYSRKHLIRKIYGKKILFCHGDDIEIGNIGYKIYRRFVGGDLMNYIFSEVLPIGFIKWLGRIASEKSRKRGGNRYENPNLQVEIKEKFIKSVNLVWKYDHYDFIIAGHSHIEESYKGEKGHYLNNGYVPSSKKFIYMTVKGAELHSIE